MKGHERLVISNELASLDRLAEVLDKIGVAQQWDSNTLFDLNLCVEEAVVNVIVHGYEDNGRHQIEVDIAYDATSVTITVLDDGIAYNPLDARGADIHAAPEERTPGGLGVHLVRALMHELAYTREDNRNRFVMKRYLGAAAISC